MLRSVADVSRETETALERFVSLVRTWTPKVNLIGPDTVPDIWTRHVLDSAQIVPCIPGDRHHWLDIGSGAGFPAIVGALLVRHSHPGLRISLVESDRRKCAFLTTAKRELDLDVSIYPDRIEAMPPLQADVITARALGPLERLFTLSAPHLAPGGRMIFPKGARYAEEIATARKRWRFTLTAEQSITSDMSRILCCEDLARV